MRAAGIKGAKRRGKPWRTTIGDPAAPKRPDLVQRDFTAVAPDRFVGRGLHVSQNLGGQGLLQLRDRRVLADDRRLAARHAHADRPRPRRAADGAVDPTTPGPRACTLASHSDRRASPYLSDRLHAAGPRARASCGAFVSTLASRLGPDVGDAVAYDANALAAIRFVGHCVQDRAACVYTTALDPAARQHSIWRARSSPIRRVGARRVVHRDACPRLRTPRRTRIPPARARVTTVSIVAYDASPPLRSANTLQHGGSRSLHPESDAALRSSTAPPAARLRGSSDRR